MSANTTSAVGGWHRTHHFPSLFDQGEHAQDVGLFRSPAHPGPPFLLLLLRGGRCPRCFCPAPPPPAGSEAAPHPGWDGEPWAERHGRVSRSSRAWSRAQEPRFGPDYSPTLPLTAAAGGRRPPPLSLRPMSRAFTPTRRQRAAICSDITNPLNMDHSGLRSFVAAEQRADAA